MTLSGGKLQAYVFIHMLRFIKKHLLTSLTLLNANSFYISSRAYDLRLCLFLCRKSTFLWANHFLYGHTPQN